MTQVLEAPGNAKPFSLLGGPLHRLGMRVGLVRGGTNTIPLGLALGGALWLALAAVALAGGTNQSWFSLSLVGVHVRLLLVIPLSFVAETWFDPRASTFVAMLRRTGVVPPEQLPALDDAAARLARLRDARLPEVVFLVLAIVVSLFGAQLNLPGATGGPDPLRAGADLPAAARFHLLVCLPVFRFLVLRWAWRLLLWTGFLARVARLDLRLVPTHPDGAGGIAYLEVVHMHLLPLVSAISAVEAAACAEDVVTGAMTFEALGPTLAVVLLADAILFLGPLCLFVPRLWTCRVKGLREYMEFAEKYVGGFDRKWLRGAAPPDEPLLGTPDLQSLADLYNSMSVVRNMRVLPFGTNLVRDYAIAAIVPLLPLLLLEYPMDELVRKFFARMSGL